MERLCYRVGEVAEALGVSESAIYDLVARRKLKVVKLNPGKGAVLIRRQDLEEFLENRLQNGFPH